MRIRTIFILVINTFILGSCICTRSGVNNVHTKVDYLPILGEYRDTYILRKRGNCIPQQIFKPPRFTILHDGVVEFHSGTEDGLIRAWIRIDSLSARNIGGNYRFKLSVEAQAKTNPCFGFSYRKEEYITMEVSGFRTSNALLKLVDDIAIKRADSINQNFTKRLLEDLTENGASDIDTLP